MRMSFHRARALIGPMVGALILAGCLSSGAGDQTTDAPTSARPDTPVVLVVDASGSMKETDVKGTRMAAAKNAAGVLIDALPEGNPFAMLTYGTNSTGKSGPGKGCQDVTVLTPLGAIDPPDAKKKVAGLSPAGWTPIGPSLRQAADLLPTGDAPAVIALISDGEDKCTPPPCEVAQEIVKQRPGVKISTIGFRASDEGLECIARSSGGVYVTADNAEQLSARLLAVTNPEHAATQLSPQGVHGVSLGMSVADAAKAAPGFPTSGQSRDEEGKTILVIEWKDCRWTFTDDQLTSIEPTGGATATIDEVKVGDPITTANQVYGEAIVRTSGDGLTNRQNEYIYPATASATGDDARNGWRVVTDSADQIIAITLCRCYVEPGWEAGAATIQLDVAGKVRSTDGSQMPTDGQQAVEWLTARLGPPTKVEPRGVVCEPSGQYGQRVEWRSFALLLKPPGDVRSFDLPPDAESLPLTAAGWTYGLWEQPPDTPPLRTTGGATVGDTFDQIRAAHPDLGPVESLYGNDDQFVASVGSFDDLGAMSFMGSDRVQMIVSGYGCGE